MILSTQKRNYNNIIQPKFPLTAIDVMIINSDNLIVHEITNYIWCLSTIISHKIKTFLKKIKFVIDDVLLWIKYKIN